MKILGIETSCDETGASVVLGGTWVLSNVIASQIDLHETHGGVVPELAAPARMFRRSCRSSKRRSRTPG
ncbi:MAG: hypothetical protein R2843_10930 [Thermomicrobiales bacterium]